MSDPYPDPDTDLIFFDYVFENYLKQDQIHGFIFMVIRGVNIPV